MSLDDDGAAAEAADEMARRASPNYYFSAEEIMAERERERRDGPERRIAKRREVARQYLLKARHLPESDT